MPQTRTSPPRGCLPAGVNCPDDLRLAPKGELPVPADQVHAFPVETVCASGGHLGPLLGVVELALVLHRVFDSLPDALIFATGHQAYVHKLPTGRWEHFGPLRQADGPSGHPARAESAQDQVENSRASAALSCTDGPTKARQLVGAHDRAVVAVIGDGALIRGPGLRSAEESRRGQGPSGDRGGERQRALVRAYARRSRLPSQPPGVLQRPGGVPQPLHGSQLPLLRSGAMATSPSSFRRPGPGPGR